MSDMRVEPVPQKAILVGMTLNSFMKWYANLYFHIPPLVKLGSADANEQPRELPGVARQALMSQHCNISRHVCILCGNQVPG